MEHDCREYRLDDFYYELPEELIAQYPLPERDDSRLFILNRRDSSYVHTTFKSIVNYLKGDDLLVFNDARVIHARIFCRRASGGIVEIVLIRRLGEMRWTFICNRTKRIKHGEALYPVKDSDILLTVTDTTRENLQLESSIELTEQVLARIGQIPLPPYIKRGDDLLDQTRYQTVYASKAGAVASPTAGLHFTDSILNKLDAKGVEKVFTTLYVSWGTFSPVRTENLREHAMHSENYSLDDGSAEKINKARNSGRRIISVGTTSLRVLESTYRNGSNFPGKGNTDIFIFPPYRIKSADVLLTNLHTPESTLLMLVAAFAGYDIIMKAYEEAVKLRYRFFSYGDAMLII